MAGTLAAEDFRTDFARRAHGCQMTDQPEAGDVNRRAYQAALGNVRAGGVEMRHRVNGFSFKRRRR